MLGIMKSRLPSNPQWVKERAGHESEPPLPGVKEPLVAGLLLCYPRKSISDSLPIIWSEKLPRTISEKLS